MYSTFAEMENLKILGASTDDTEYTIDNLIRAVQWGDGRFVEAAIENYGMLPSSSDGDHCSLLHWAAINNRYDIARYLLSKDVDVNFVGGLNKEISLQWAVRTQRSSRLVQLLIAEGSDAQHKSIYGCDALFIAVQAMNLHAALVLLNSGANPNSVDMHGDTPLYVLLRRPTSIQSHDMIRLLLRFKASVNIKTNIGDTAMHIIAAGGFNFEVYRSQLIYCSGNVIENLKTLNNEQLTPYDVSFRQPLFCSNKF
jgi:palmitoyltransferase